MNLFVLAAQCDGLENFIPIAGFILRIIKYAAPILLILWGSIDMVKSIIAGKEDDIKKNQKTLVKRAIAAIILFLVPFLVSIGLGLIGSDEWKACWTENKNKPLTDFSKY